MTPRQLDELVDRYGAATVCEALAPMLTPERIARIDAVLDARLGSLINVVEDVYDPHNAAATIRTSEALGLQELHVIELGQKFSIAHGVTRGAHDWLDIAKWSTADACITHLKGRGFRTLATMPDAADDLETVDVSQPIAVFYGNEHDGLSNGVLRACDDRIKVAMYGMSESFNLSVTVGLATARLAARRRIHLGTKGDLDPTRRDRLRARWFAAKIRGVEGVLARLL